MRRILGIFRGFPGLGRVVSGLSLLETMRDKYGCKVEAISYLQGNRYLELKGYEISQEVSPMDFCSIGLLPTNTMGAYIHKKVRNLRPDLVIIDGEPLIIQSLKISHPLLKVVALVNPSDIENRENDQDAMSYFNTMYSLADLTIVHGLRSVLNTGVYKRLLSLNTILRWEILDVCNCRTKEIYCLLGGGTVNVGDLFAQSTAQIAKLCMDASAYLSEYKMHIICSSQNIYFELNKYEHGENVILHDGILDMRQCYSKAGLVITRSGRNTLSELAYLGIPALSFLSGCQYRQAEQRQNLEALGAPNVKPVDIRIQPQKFADQIKDMIAKPYQRKRFTPGNEQAIQEILKL